MYCDNYFENIDAMDDFLRKYNVPKLIQIVKTISYVIKGMSQKKTLGTFKIRCVTIKSGDWVLILALPFVSSITLVWLPDLANKNSMLN